MAFPSLDSSSTARLHDDEPRVYALLSAENPYFGDQARQIAEKLGKSVGTNQRRAFEMKWDRPDLRILYRSGDSLVLPPFPPPPQDLHTI